MSGILGVACIFDLKYKKKFIEYYFSMVYGGVKELYVGKVVTLCRELVEEYQLKFSPTVYCFDYTVVADELDSFLDEKVIPRMEDFNILSWWKTNANRYSTLARIARDILAIPITTVASESAFSTGLKSETISQFATFLEEEQEEQDEHETHDLLLLALFFVSCLNILGSEQMEKVKDCNYKVVEKIGQGVFGEVYKCLNRETGQKAAIKMIAIQNEADGVPSYLIAGVSLLKELEHDNIVRLLDVLNGDRYWYLVFEYLDLDLGSLIRKHTITSIRPLIKTILSQILVGLAYYHSHNILHGDLQPSNVLIDLNSKKVKLADFGLSVSFGVPHTEYSYDEVEFPYKAPESRICSSVYMTPHDVWAVGCIFAEMVSGKPLFPCGKKDHLSLIVRLFGNPTKETWPGANYISELLHSLPQCEPADLAEKTHGLEPSGVELLSQMLCLDPDHRVTANDALCIGTSEIKISNIMVKYRYTESADTVPSGLPAAVRNDQNQDFEKASRSSPSCDQGVYSSQMRDKVEDFELFMQFHISVIICPGSTYSSTGIFAV
ncbi:protein kinase domain-containing protein [Citrus sinensis]|uniref:Protein kinase domain-containing protein n=1 Tax=Citrus sinensis TaxID=2711 RepID=A0ACB8JUC5_CITSI|nr:protein kinase domain-containing protein [Citrus sinensis]